MSSKLAGLQDKWFEKTISLLNKVGIKCLNPDVNHNLKLRVWPLPTGADWEWSKIGPNLWVNAVYPWVFRDDTWYCWDTNCYMIVDKSRKFIYSYNKPVTFPYTPKPSQYIKQGSLKHLTILARKVLGVL